MVNGQPERHTEGAYYLEWREGPKRVRLSVGKDAVDAEGRRKRKAAELNAVNEGAALVPENAGPRSVRRAVAEYLEETKLTKKPKTLAAYGTALRYFLESCHKLNIEDLDRRDLLKFCAFLRDEKDQAPRSVYNKFENLMSFLKAQGTRGLVGKNDWPRFTEEEPEIYEAAELDKLFATCGAEERLWYEFFLMTGEREQEVMFTYWTDVNFAASTVRVSHKPDRGWTPKAYKEREIPIPTKLAKSLKAWKAKASKGCALVFPTAGCRPKLDFLDCLKAVVKRTRLDPDNFWLAQIPGHVCHEMSVGGRGSAHRATVARALGHGKHHALFEAVAESTHAGQGKRDFLLRTPLVGVPRPQCDYFRFARQV